MSIDEAELFEVDEEMRRSLIRLDSGKVNIAPPARDAKWFQLVGVLLGNATKTYPAGDNVQTVEMWQPPSAWDSLDRDTIHRIIDDIDAGLPNGSRYSAANAATIKAAWKVVVKHATDKCERHAKEIIKTWIKNGVLETRQYYEPDDRKNRAGLFANPINRPT